MRRFSASQFTVNNFDRHYEDRRQKDSHRRYGRIVNPANLLRDGLMIFIMLLVPLNLEYLDNPSTKELLIILMITYTLHTLIRVKQLLPHIVPYLSVPNFIETLLSLYPRDFAEKYGSEMFLVIQEECRVAFKEGGRAAYRKALIAAILDIIWNVILVRSSRLSPLWAIQKVSHFIELSLPKKGGNEHVSQSQH
jgi:hypothetical protein